MSAEKVEHTALAGRDVVVVSSIDWDFKWQGPQEIAVRLARMGNRVVFIENPGVRAPSLRDARRVMSRARNLLASLKSGLREVEEGVILCTPAVFGPFGSALRRRLNALLLRLSVGRTVRKLRVRDPVIFLCLVTDISKKMVEMSAGPRSKIVYYAISDLLVMTDHPEEMEKLEREVIESADLIFTTYMPLVSRFGIQRKGVYLLPYGVNLDRFHLEGRVKRLSQRPTVGYVGGISQHLDTDLLGDLVRANPDWEFVLVGPNEAGAGPLPDAPNLHRPGHVLHAELPEWVRGFDVCLIPYRRSAYTDTVYPVKLNEYLALGKPVVSVDLPALEEFQEKGVLELASADAPAFEERIAALLPVSGDPSLVSRRREIAEAHDWERRVAEMSRLILQI